MAPTAVVRNAHATPMPMMALGTDMEGSNVTIRMHRLNCRNTHTRKTSSIKCVCHPCFNVGHSMRGNVLSVSTEMKPRRGLCVYLSLQVKGHHGETQVQQKVLLLVALQGPAHAERHRVGPPDEEQGAEDVERT